MSILNPLGAANAKSDGDFIPDLPIVESPPLPAAVLSAEALDNLPTAGMLSDIGCAVQDDIVDYDDFITARGGQWCRC